MCGYTLISYLQCPCQAVSSAVKDTQLCDLAELSHLIQGVDHAPAPCFISNDTETIIVARQQRAGCCEDCRRPPTADLERGVLDDIVQPHAHQEDPGEFGDNETSQLHDLRYFIDTKIVNGQRVFAAFDALVSSTPGILAHISSPLLRQILFQSRSAQNNNIISIQSFFNDYQVYSGMLPILEMYARDRAPNSLFEDTFAYVVAKAKWTTSIMEYFEVILECLTNYQAPRPHEHSNGWAVRLSLAEDVLAHLITKTKPDVTPKGFEHLDREFKVSDELLDSFREREEAREKESNMRVHFAARDPNEPPRAFRFREEAFQRSLPKGSTIQARRDRGGGMNLRNLTVSPPAGLLDDEPATDVEIEHVPLADGDVPTDFDVKDKQGNKLTWDEHSRPIVFGMKSIDISAQLSHEQPAQSSVQQSSPSEHQPSLSPRSREGRSISVPRTGSETGDPAVDAADVNSPVHGRPRSIQSNAEHTELTHPVSTVTSGVQTRGIKRKHNPPRDDIGRTFGLSYSDSESGDDDDDEEDQDKDGQETEGDPNVPDESIVDAVNQKTRQTSVDITEQVPAVSPLHTPGSPPTRVSSSPRVSPRRSARIAALEPSSTPDVAGHVQEFAVKRAPRPQSRHSRKRVKLSSDDDEQ